MEPHSKQNYTSLSTLAIIGATVVLCLYMMLPNSVQAHGAGMTFSATTTEDYIVDVDYSDYDIQAGRIGRFDFNLFTDYTRSKSAEFTDIWVRITEDSDGESDRTFFAGGIAKQEFGGNGFSIVFPEGGAYTVSVRYNNANNGTLGETAGEAEFKIPVVNSDDEAQFKFEKEFWIGIIGGLFAAGIGFLLVFAHRKGATKWKKQ